MNTQIEEPKPKRIIGRLSSGRQVIPKPEPSVALMLQKVIDKGITAENVQALDSLVGLYDRMQSKQAEKEFSQAFSELQAELPDIAAIKPVYAKDGTVKYHYAPYEEILDKVRPFLKKHGFSISFNTDTKDGRITSICTLRHISGHSQTNQFGVRIGSGPPHATEPQADTSAKNMAKRGALSDALNIVVDHDDDARMIGKPIGNALALDLYNRVKETKSDERAFLKFAGIDIGNREPDQSDYALITDERFDALDEILRRKEGKLI